MNIFGGGIFPPIVVPLTHIDLFSPHPRPHLSCAIHTPDLLTKRPGFISGGAPGPRQAGLCRQLQPGCSEALGSLAEEHQGSALSRQGSWVPRQVPRSCGWSVEALPFSHCLLFILPSNVPLPAWLRVLTGSQCTPSVSSECVLY